MPARLHFSFFCDATANSAGKWTYIGVFDSMGALQFPAAHPAMKLVGRISAEPGPHEVVIHFRRQDGTDYIPPVIRVAFSSLEFQKNDFDFGIEGFPLLLRPADNQIFVTAEWHVDGVKIGETELRLFRVQQGRVNRGNND